MPAASHLIPKSTIIERGPDYIVAPVQQSSPGTRDASSPGTRDAAKVAPVLTKLPLVAPVLPFSLGEPFAVSPALFSHDLISRHVRQGGAAPYVLLSDSEEEFLDSLSRFDWLDTMRFRYELYVGFLRAGACGVIADVSEEFLSYLDTRK